MAKETHAAAELGAIELVSSSALRDYTKLGRDIQKDLYLELEFGASILRPALESIPPAVSARGVPVNVNQKVRAKQVADLLRKAAEANKHAAAMITKAWSLYLRNYAPELEQAKKNAKPQFKVNE